MLSEMPCVEPSGATHKVAMLYHNREEIEKARLSGRRNRSEYCGKGYIWIKDDEKLKDYSNENATDIYVKGEIYLDNIFPSDIISDPFKGHRHFKCSFRAVKNGTPIYLNGYVMMSDIMDEDIVINPNTGKKTLPCVLRKLKMSDPFFQTHGLYLTRKDGNEIEIGRFKEYKEATEINQRIVSAQEELDPQVLENEEELPKQPPIYLDGYKF
jgi:hypothetical protein